jgi:hypothetical protein
MTHLASAISSAKIEAYPESGENRENRQKKSGGGDIRESSKK